MTATKMTADLSGLKHGLKSSHRKEQTGLRRSFTLLDLTRRYDHNGYREAAERVTVRTYWPGSVCYACAWITSDMYQGNGSGQAGGGGYCKESAAVDSAFRSAGIQLSESIHGVGIGAIRDALVAIAESMGLTDYIIVESHA